ncbi:MAG TPA: glycosyltransferase family 2 protein [Thermoanaerobaculia bacterium]|nr:glycosyltransferase family 2 protein [Thermoanaerobaculia bacterium]
MRLAVILVHYHTPELAAEALAALRADVARVEGGIEWLLVDNGSTAEERALLERLPVRRIDPGRNLGYAGGVNLGVAESSAESILLMNPDVLVLPGCVPALLACLDGGAAVAGPRFYWDRTHRLLLPPAERRTRRDELLALLAAHCEPWAARARRRWRRHARRHWEAVRPLRSPWLSGSLLAVRRRAWERAGPFDEGFRLFYEETDWLLRVWRLGLPIWYVPGAEAIHLYNQSAGQEPRAGQWFEESAQRFRRLHYGAWFARLLTAVDSRLGRAGLRPPPAAPSMEIELPPGAAWVELSPNATGFPAAAERVSRSAGSRWAPPAEIAGALPPAGLRVQVADAAGREAARWSLSSGA